MVMRMRMRMRTRLGWCLCLGLFACGEGEGDEVALDGSTGSAGSAGSASPSTATAATMSAGDDGGDPGGPTTGEDTGGPGPGPGTDDTAGPGDSTDGGPPPSPLLPPADAALDYQLGGAYPPPAGVEIVSRDRNDPPAAGLYNICYINGYQAQPDEADWWLGEHPDLVLRDANGDPVIDPDWDEMLLDISTPEKREALAAIVGEWITTCAADGFDAIEIDNLDTYSRSDGLLTQDQAVDYMSLLSAVAHDAGLAIAQKNSTELVDRKGEMGTDFVVAEECNRYSECEDYMAGYGDAVLVIEYRSEDFDVGCADFPQLSIVLRDLDLVPEGDPGYVYEGC